MKSDNHSPVDKRCLLPLPCIGLSQGMIIRTGFPKGRHMDFEPGKPQEETVLCPS